MRDCRICGKHLSGNAGEHFVVCITIVNELATSVDNKSYCRECYKRRVLPALRRLRDDAEMIMGLEDGE